MFRDHLASAHSVGSYACRVLPSDAAVELVARTDQRRRVATSGLDAARRVKLGQFFTPGQVAMFMAQLAVLPSGGLVRVLDPGAGVGSLAAALVARIVAGHPDVNVDITVFELDDTLIDRLEETLADCKEVVERFGGSLTYRLLNEDFVEWGVGQLGHDEVAERERFDLIITNPPYKKINATSPDRQALKAAGIDVSNIYAGFLALCTSLLGERGQMVAITPRSFANGVYFRAFRRYMLERVCLTHMHVFESRRHAFAEDDVLQENVIFRAVREDQRERDVILSSSDGPDSPVSHREVPFAQVVFPGDPQQFIHISHDAKHSVVAAAIAALPDSLGDLGLKVSTGKVVDFRALEYLKDDFEEGTVPLIYPLHFRNGQINWPVPGARKPNALVECKETASLLLPAGNYVVVRRMSSKEERRRISPAVFDLQEVKCERVAFENHLNVIHQDNRGMSIELARGLATWLSSQVVDIAIRQFSGHTQVNATDLRQMRYPSRETLIAIGTKCGLAQLDQQKIDALVFQYTGIDASAA